MIKSFTLEKIEEEKLSATSGKMTFHLTDEKGDSRAVTGDTKLMDGYAVEIYSPHKREMPLLQCLFDAKIKDTINIEFTQYNEIFGRENDNRAMSIAEIAEVMQNKPLRLGPLIKS